MTVLAIAALLAISRAELIERFKAPVITQADGLVKVSTGNVSSVTDIKCLLGWQHGDMVTPNLSSDNELVYQLII